ncbi:hypothetical protein [uncultured Erythrobacter sp.]|uniref:hypothetical protein n=1 Tax=uncultured Erythrobacter sp. TaxID=263913 RepID=UPI0026192B53|nr:hypothetical protein [uncultured Erythrobacter sp.]
MTSLPARVVFVTRETEYELLINRHATVEQARFFLETRGQKLSVLEDRHERFLETLKLARAAVPDEWRQALVQRADLDRFLFSAEDIVVPVGQDGLVANVAKYLDGQFVIGVNPNPDLYDGVLVQHRVESLPKSLAASVAQDWDCQQRTMVEGSLDTGERLFALNELFIGHQTHQSARYEIACDGTRENHSSSGVIAASGTGATGWARSIMDATHQRIDLRHDERAIAYFVREPFPSVATGTDLRAGKIETKPLTITSRMNDGGVIFADGIEQDYLPFDWGKTLTVKPSERSLKLVTA